MGKETVNWIEFEKGSFVATINGRRFTIRRCISRWSKSVPNIGFGTHRIRHTDTYYAITEVIKSGTDTEDPIIRDVDFVKGLKKAKSIAVRTAFETTGKEVTL